jgi:hypothetical protein
VYNLKLSIERKKRDLACIANQLKEMVGNLYGCEVKENAGCEAHFFSFLAAAAAASSAAFSSADLAWTPVKISKWALRSPTGLIRPRLTPSRMRAREMEPLTLNFSQSVARVMQRIFVIS